MELKLNLSLIITQTSYLRYIRARILSGMPKTQRALTYFTRTLLCHVLFSCLPLNLFYLIWFTRSPFPLT